MFDCPFELHYMTYILASLLIFIACPKRSWSLGLALAEPHDIYLGAGLDFSAQTAREIKIAMEVIRQNGQLKKA